MNDDALETRAEDGHPPDARETRLDRATSWAWLTLASVLIVYVALLVVGAVLDLLPTATDLRCGW